MENDPETTSEPQQDSDNFLRELCLRLNQEPPNLDTPNLNTAPIVNPANGITAQAVPLPPQFNGTQDSGMLDDDQTESSSSQHEDGGLGGGSVMLGVDGQPQLDYMPSDEQQPMSLQDEVSSLSRHCTFLSHQINILMKHIRVPFCQCADCLDHLRNANSFSRPRPVARINGHHDVNAASSQPPVLQAYPPQPSAAQLNPSTPRGSMEDKNETDMQTQFIQQLMAQENAMSSGGPMLGSSSPNRGGRKSKYCTTPEGKKAVAEYAAAHGAAAAARHFNIPPPVAAYYQRKHTQKANHAAQQQVLAALEASGVSPQVLLAGASPLVPGPVRSADSTPARTPIASTPTTPMQSMHQEPFKMNGMPGLTGPIHTPNPMFVRGRGRGRPKLIGDELDMHLVEYMVQYKKSDPTHHLTASRALDVARTYIVEKAPGLLEEHGGAIKLKITWAMKLVQRVAEREREIEMGLPPGTLQNLGRFLQQMPNGTFNPMDLVAAQNMMQQNGGAGQPTLDKGHPEIEAVFNAIMQNVQNGANPDENKAVNMPEIIKGGEIDIAALLNLCAQDESTAGDNEMSEMVASAEDDEDVDASQKSASASPPVAEMSTIAPSTSQHQEQQPTTNGQHPNYIFAS